MMSPSLDSSSQADKLIHVKGGAKCIRVLHIVLKNEYKGSAVTCLAPYVLALESWVTKTLHANARTKIKKEGIVEILNLTDTLLFSIMIDLLVLPPLAEYFTNLTLLDDLVTSMINEDEDETSACTNVGSSRSVDFTCLSITQGFRTKKLDVFRQVPQDHVINLIEQCRSCRENENTQGGTSAH